MRKPRDLSKCQWSIASGQVRVTEKGVLAKNPLMELPGMDPTLTKVIGNRMISLQLYQKTKGSYWKNRLCFSLESD